MPSELKMPTNITNITIIIVNNHISIPSSGMEGIRVTDDVIEKLAHEVWHGKWGDGAERKRRLGPLYSAVQHRVNELAPVYQG